MAWRHRTNRRSSLWPTSKRCEPTKLIAAILSPWSARYQWPMRRADPRERLPDGDKLIDRQRPGELVNDPGIVQSTSAQPMSASGSPTVAISQSNTALTSPPLKGEVPGLGIAVNECHCRALFRLLFAKRRHQSFERRKRTASGPADLVGPVIELTVEIPLPVADRIQPGRLQIDGVDGGDLLDHALAHTPDHGRGRWPAPPGSPARRRLPAAAP